MYEKSHGMERNDAEAVRLYRLAADQGYAVAESNLGHMYSEGLGAEQNDAEAIKLNRLAADRGFAHAQFHLGIAYEHGRGVPQDEALAYMWFSLSAAQGDGDGIRKRDKLAGTLTPDQIAEAQRLAQAWKPTK
jgi:TPR repeat protein